jgi:hypothetical protein
VLIGEHVGLQTRTAAVRFRPPLPSKGGKEMPKCQVKGCNEEAGYNPKNGKPNLVCKKHYKVLNDANIEIGSVVARKIGTTTQKTKKQSILKPKAPAVETFILRGNTLTVNSSNKTAHYKVDRYTRAVIFNEDVLDVSGTPGRYLLEIKQGSITIKSLVYKKKHERDNDFAKLQNLLSRL